MTVLLYFKQLSPFISSQMSFSLTKVAYTMAISQDKTFNVLIKCLYVYFRHLSLGRENPQGIYCKAFL